MLYETCINTAFQGVFVEQTAPLKHWNQPSADVVSVLDVDDSVANLPKPPVTSGCWVNAYSIYLFHSYCLSYTLTHTFPYRPLHRQASRRPPSLLYFVSSSCCNPLCVPCFSKWRLPLSPTATPWWWAGYCHVRRLCYAHPFAPSRK